MRCKKGQSAIEFIILISIMLFFFILLMYGITERTDEKRFLEEQAVVREIGLSIQNELALAKEASDGYSRTFEVQNKIKGQDYTLEHDGNIISIQATRVSSSYNVILVDSGTVMIGSNTITKSGGLVDITQP